MKLQVLFFTVLLMLGLLPLSAVSEISNESKKIQDSIQPNFVAYGERGTSINGFPLNNFAMSPAVTTATCLEIQQLLNLPGVDNYLNLKDEFRTNSRSPFVCSVIVSPTSVTYPQSGATIPISFSISSYDPGAGCSAGASCGLESGCSITYSYGTNCNLMQPCSATFGFRLPANTNTVTRNGSFQVAGVYVPYTQPGISVSISGQITDDSVNHLPVGSVTVTLTGTESRSVQTDTNGVYTFNNLTSGGNYVVTPTHSGWTFNPVNRSFNNLTTAGAGHFEGSQARIEITLENPPQNNTYVITAEPKMPIIQARAKVLGVTPDPTATRTFRWFIELTINKGTGETVDISGVCQGQQTVGNTGGQGLFTLKSGITDLLLNCYLDPTLIRGGKLKLRAQAILANNQTVIGEFGQNVEIKGTNPTRADIQNWVDQNVQTMAARGKRVFGLSPEASKDAFKRKICQESQQRQFNANPGAIGNPIITSDNGIGIAQITTTNACPDPFLACPDVIFNWKANLKESVRKYDDSLRVAREYPGRLRGNLTYSLYIATVINPARQANNLEPIPADNPPAPEFTSSGRIGEIINCGPGQTCVANQVLEAALRAYNGAAGTAFGMPLQEFIPDENFLKTVPDNALSTLSTNSRVWRRVLPEERPMIGDRSYVFNVISRSPTCGN